MTDARNRGCARGYARPHAPEGRYRIPCALLSAAPKSLLGQDYRTRSIFSNGDLCSQAGGEPVTRTLSNITKGDERPRQTPSESREATEACSRVIDRKLTCELRDGDDEDEIEEEFE